MNPQFVFLMNQSLQYLRSDNLSSAEPLLKQAQKLAPNNPDVLRLLGVLYGKKGDHQESLRYLKKASQLAPKNALIHSNIGNVLQSLGRFKAAVDAYEMAVKLDPNYAEAYTNLGNALSELNLLEKALAAHQKAIQLAPNYAEALSNMGNVLFALRRYDEALKSLQHAVNLAPEYPEGHCNLGLIYKHYKNYVNALAEFNIAIHLKPNYPKAWLNKAVLFENVGKHLDAIEACVEAINLKPDFIEAWLSKATSLLQIKSYQESISAWSKALALNPEVRYASGNRLNCQMLTAEWGGTKNEIDKLCSRIKSGDDVINPFMFLAFVDSPELHFLAAKNFIEDQFPSNDLLPAIEKKKHSKIRLGYFSADFRNHPVAYLMAEIFELHNRDEFEVYAFSFLRAEPTDPIRDRLVRAFDHFIDVDEKNSEDIARLCREHEIDIVVDLGGHTQFSGTGTLAYRAAPIQVGYLGYPGTVGAEYMDYIIADKTLIPEGSNQFYTEKVAYLPNSYMPNDSGMKPSDRVFSRSEFNLPEAGVVFCCFNHGYKFNPALLDSWVNILKNVSDSVIWIPENNPTFMKNIVAEFEMRGIDSKRVIFAARLDSVSDHLARYRLADLFLDTNPYNAHTTALDSLKAGVPVVTVLGESFPARVAASFLNTLEMPELICANPEEYEALAIELSNNPEKLKAIKEKLTNKLETTPLLDTALFAKNLESVYQKMYERYQNDLPPDHFSV